MMSGKTQLYLVMFLAVAWNTLAPKRPPKPGADNVWPATILTLVWFGGIVWVLWWRADAWIHDKPYSSRLRDDLLLIFAITVIILMFLMTGVTPSLPVLN